MAHKFLIILLTVFGWAVKAQESTASAAVSSFTIDAPQLNGPRKIWTYLPKSYDISTHRYPVIYMHDAQNLFDKNTSYAGEWRVDEVLDSLQAQVIVIGIEHGGEKRLDELTPYKNEKYGGGGTDAYLNLLLHTLKPYVDENYRTKPDIANTAIFGSSLGGLTSFYALLQYPEVFGKAVVFSPSFWYSNEIYTLAGSFPEIKGRLYLMCGDSESEDMVPDLERMYGLIYEKMKDKTQLRKKVVPGGKHNEALWAKEFVEAYLWLFNRS